MINIQVYFSTMDNDTIESPKTKKKYIVTKQLGRGSYGLVYFSDPYAIKVVNLAHAEPKVIEMLKNQAKLLSEIKNKNVVSLIEYFEIGKYLYLVMQYCQTDLQKYLKDNKGLSEQKLLCIFKQVLSGYKEAYIKNIIHRDIKPANILVKNNSQFKLADFGFARKIGRQNQLLETCVGTPLYSSPQVLKSQQYTIKNDIWSLGVLLYFMIFNQYPWKTNNYIVLLQKIQQGLKLPEDNKVSDSTKILLRKMLMTEEKERISWIQLFKFFNIRVPSQNQQNRRQKQAQKEQKEQKEKEANSLKKRDEMKKKINQQYSCNQRSVSLHSNPRLKRLGKEYNKKPQKNKSQAGQNEGESKIKIVSLLIQGAKKFRSFLSSTSNKDTWTSEEIKQLIQAEGSIYCGLVAGKVFTKKYQNMNSCERDDFRKILQNFNVTFQNAAKLVYQFPDQ